MKPIADFEAILTKVVTMIDGPRIYLDLQEHETGILAKLAELKYGDKFLHVVIYDEDEFMKEVENK